MGKDRERNRRRGRVGSQMKEKRSMWRRESLL